MDSFENQTGAFAEYSEEKMNDLRVRMSRLSGKDDNRTFEANAWADKDERMESKVSDVEKLNRLTTAMRRQERDEKIQEAEQKASSEDANADWTAFQTKVRKSFKTRYGKSRDARIKDIDWDTFDIGGDQAKLLIQRIEEDNNQASKAFSRQLHDLISRMPDLSDAGTLDEPFEGQDDYENFFGGLDDIDNDATVKELPTASVFYSLPSSSEFTLYQNKESALIRAVRDHFNGDLSQLNDKVLNGLPDDILNMIYNNANELMGKAVRPSDRLNTEEIRERKLDRIAEFHPSRVDAAKFKQRLDKVNQDERKKFLKQ